MTSGGVLVVDQGEQKVLEGRVFVAALIGEGQGPVKRLFETARETRHRSALSVPGGRCMALRYFFSITHCSGCMCLRAKSMTRVTLVSATS